MPLAVLVMLSGCLGGGGAKYTIVGTVTEEDTGIPLWGATVSVGSGSAVTDQDGKYVLTGVPGGVQRLEVLLEGYEPMSRNLDIKSDRRPLDIGLVSPLPPLNSEAIVLRDFNSNLVENGGIVNLPTLNVRVFENLLFGPDASIWDIVILKDGRERSVWKSALIPLDFGENSFRIRAWSDGYARTSELFTVNLEMERLDLRVRLEWGGSTDLGLHMFKRTPGEGNVFDEHSSDRHIYWDNARPNDFGDGGAQNPVFESDWYSDVEWEGLVLVEATPGDYHIWVYPYMVAPVADAELIIVIDGAGEDAQEVRYSLNLDAYSEGKPQYVVTVRVDENGSKTLAELPTN